MPYPMAIVYPHQPRVGEEVTIWRRLSSAFLSARPLLCTFEERYR
jgi:hypothetical protein